MATEKKVKKEIIHTDKLGRVLAVGDAVCYPDRNSLDLGTVKKLNDKMVTVWEVGQQHYSWYKGSRKYPHDLIKVDGPEVTMYLLRSKTTKS
jgi:hypothetical protein